MTVWTDIAEELRSLARGGNRAPAQPPRRYRVKSTSPLILEAHDGGDLLDEGDPDVEVAKHVKDDAAAGDTVVVHEADGDLLATALVKQEG